MEHRKRIPAGQARPYPRVKSYPNAKTGRDATEFVYPHEIVRVHSRDSLEKALEHYSHALPMLAGSGHLASKDGLRYTIEWAFPALRWFCKTYNVTAPPWLQANGWADGMSPKDFRRFFGDSPLAVKEWVEDPAEAGQR